MPDHVIVEKRSGFLGGCTGGCLGSMLGVAAIVAVVVALIVGVIVVVGRATKDAVGQARQAAAKAKAIHDAKAKSQPVAPPEVTPVETAPAKDQ